MDIIIKIFGLGLIGAIGSMILNKSGKAEIAFIFDLILLVVALGMVYKEVNALFKNMTSMFGW